MRDNDNPFKTDESYMRKQKELHHREAELILHSPNTWIERRAELAADPTIDPERISDIIRVERQELELTLKRNQIRKLMDQVGQAVRSGALSFSPQVDRSMRGGEASWHER